MRLRRTVEEPRLCQWCPLMALLKLVSVKNDYIGFVPYWYKPSERHESLKFLHPLFAQQLCSV